MDSKAFYLGVLEELEKTAANPVVPPATNTASGLAAAQGSSKGSVGSNYLNSPKPNLKEYQNSAEGRETAYNRAGLGRTQEQMSAAPPVDPMPQDPVAKGYSAFLSPSRIGDEYGNMLPDNYIVSKAVESYRSGEGNNPEGLQRLMTLQTDNPGAYNKVMAALGKETGNSIRAGNFDAGTVDPNAATIAKANPGYAKEVNQAIQDKSYGVKSLNTSNNPYNNTKWTPEKIQWGNLFKDHWGKILTGVLGVGGLAALLGQGNSEPQHTTSQAPPTSAPPPSSGPQWV